MASDHGDDWIVDDDDPPTTPAWLVRTAIAVGGTCAVILAVLMAINLF